MAGFIELSDSREWSSANWVYYSIMDALLEDIARLGNEELRTDIEQSKWMQTFSLSEIPVVEWRDVAIESLMRVCESVDCGLLVAKVEGKTLDESSQIEFKSEVSKLADELKAMASESAGQ
jgi:hypothetical protein